MKKVLIVVDMQNDFCPGGALAVTDGDKVIPVINGMADKFDLVVTTQDWHPADHCSFSNNGGLWPTHCVVETDGARLHSELKIISCCSVFKGSMSEFDSYSGFKDDGGNKTILESVLEDYYIEEVYICGLATDYCVKFTALDSIAVGFKTSVIVDACRGVNVNEGDVDKALEEMKDAGVALVESRDV